MFTRLLKKSPSVFVAVALLLSVLSFQNNAEEAQATQGCSTAICVLENGALRFGNGSENSINNSGNFQQPFYFSANANAYKKLTYSSYPLDMAIGTGNAGGNWSGTNVVEISDTAMTNRVVDYSGFTTTTTNGTVSKGYGTIVVSGNFTINSQQIKVTNTFSLGQTDSFVRIDTAVQNLDSNPVQNLHIWVGTRDDWVGDSDGPTKYRGNLSGAGGSFQAITNASSQAQAIQITTSQEGALFYSTTPGANTSIDWCCSFSNAYNMNPSQSPITLSGDGSYAAVLPAGNIPSSSTAVITWFYAAGSLQDLNNVAQAVAAAAAPSVPTVSRGDGQAVVSWETPRSTDPIVNYTLRYSSNNGATWTEVPINPASTATSATVTGLNNGSTYIFQVRAITSNGSTNTNGDWSGSSEPSTLATPYAPTALVPTGGDSSVSLNFSPAASPISPITRYEYSVDNGSTWLTTSPALPTSPVTISGLTNGQQYSVKLRAVNIYGAGLSAASSNFVTKPTWINSVINSSFRVGASYSSSVSAQTVITSYSVSSGSLPAGISLNSSSGVLSGTPTTAGTFNFTLRATNAGGFVEASQQVTVQPPLPTWTDQALANVVALDSYLDGVTAQHASLYEVSSGTLPTGLALNALTGVVSGVASVPGQSYSFVIKATAPGGNLTKSFSGTVGIARPVWDVTTIGALRSGVAFSGSATATGATSYSISSGSLPTGLSFNSSTGMISGTPTALGPYSFTLSATNSSGSRTQIFSGAVSNPVTIVTQNGVTPAVVPGRSQVIENGTPVSTILQVVNSGVELRGTGFQLGLGAECNVSTCEVSRDSSGNPFLVIEPTGQLIVEGDGFAPGSLVDVWMFSTPRYVGTVTVGPNGGFSAKFSLQSLAVPPGNHTLQASGVTVNGEQRVANIGLQVKSVPLPQTGQTFWIFTPALISSALFLLGAALLFLRNRFFKSL